jgi:succinate dehydrogenase / fumarate reductase cytochrome b subunit
MSWFIRSLSSSLGKKYIMAVSGLLLGGFLLVHAAGNTTILVGRPAFLAYAGHLHKLGLLLAVVEGLLLFVFLVHMTIGLILFVQNRSARGSRYAVSRSAGGSTWGSTTMPYTGILILCFILLHLYNFQFLDPGLSIADQVARVLNSPLYGMLYIIGLCALALHISHGFWSMFQSLGVNHPGYNCFIRTAAWIVCGLIVAVFVVIVLLLLANSNYLA